MPITMIWINKSNQIKSNQIKSNQIKSNHSTHLSLNDCVDWGRLQRLGQELPHGSQSEELDGEGQLVQRSPEHLGGHVLVQFVVSGVGEFAKCLLIFQVCFFKLCSI
jgi:hypothetical protein